MNLGEYVGQCDSLPRLHIVDFSKGGSQVECEHPGHHRINVGWEGGSGAEVEMVCGECDGISNAGSSWITKGEGSTL